MDPVNAWLTQHMWDPIVGYLLLVSFVISVSAMAFEVFHFPSRLK